MRAYNLGNQDNTFEVEVEDISVVTQNEDAIDSSIDKMLKLVEDQLDKLDIDWDLIKQKSIENGGEDPTEQLKEYGIDYTKITSFDDVKEVMKSTIKVAYVPANTLVLYTKEADETNSLTEAIDTIMEEVDKVYKEEEKQYKKEHSGGSSSDDNSGESSGDNSGENSGESSGENSGESSSDNSGESSDENSGESSSDNSGDNSGESSSDNSGESSGDNSGDNSGESSGESSDETELPKSPISGDYTSYESQIEDYLKESGITDDIDNMSDEDLQALAENIAAEIQNVYAGGTTSNPIASGIMEQMKSLTSKAGGSGKSRFGLWKALYVAMRVAIKVPDLTCAVYSAAICLVAASYFTLGTMYISIHFGGTSIIGVGVSLVCLAIQNVLTGTTIMMQSTQDSNYITNTFSQCKGVANAISNMFTNGKIIELVVGTFIPGVIVLPFVGVGTSTSINHNAVKVIILVAAIASYLILWVSALESNLLQSSIIWDNMLGTIFENGDDLYACLLAAGIKLSLLLTLTRSHEYVAQSSGIGLLLPIGP